MGVDETGKIQKKKKKLWIIIPAIIVLVLTLAALGYYYYFFYYLKPHFDNNQLNFIMQSSSEIHPGENINFEINYKNTGNLRIEKFIIDTKIPDYTRFVSSSQNSKFNSSDSSIQFNIGRLDKNTSGKVSFTVKVEKPLDNGTRIISKEVVFKYFTRGKNEIYKITNSVESIVKSNPNFNNLSVKIVDLNGGKISMGDDLAFDISVLNTGDMNAKKVKIINIMPEKFELLKNFIFPDAKYDNKSNELVWELDDLNTGSLKTFTFRVKVGNNFSHLESFKDIVKLEYEGGVKKESSIEDKVWGPPDLSNSANEVIDLNGGDIWAGDMLEYKIIVKNSGWQAGENIKLFCPIPEGTSYIQKSANPEVGKWSDEIKGIEWEIVKIEVGEEKVFTFDVKIGNSFSRGGKVISNFSIKGNEQEFQIEPSLINVRSYIFQTIVCMGDSQIPVTNWPAVLDQILESTYPHAEFKTIGSGVPQQMAYQGVRRFDSTVAVYKPKVVVIGYGTNDAGSPGGKDLFRSGMVELINKAKNIGAIVLVHSIGYIDISQQPAKKSYLEYNEVLREVCVENGVPYIDLYSAMAQDSGRYLSGDGMHLSSEGGTLLAHLVFNTLKNYLDTEGKKK